MAYTKNVWVDQDVERPKTYEFNENSDGSSTLIERFGNVVTLGTPVNAENMNRIEDGIEANSIELENKANKNLANVNPARSFIELSNNWVMPDYNNKISKATNTEFTADADGWLLCTIAANNSNVYGTIHINAWSFYLLCMDTQNRSGQDTCGIFPVAKGDSFKMETQDGLTSTPHASLYFIPMKGDN